MWEMVRFGAMCEIFTDGDWIETKNQSDEGIRLIQTGNIKEGYFANRRGKARFISEETFRELKCTEVLEGDILVSRLPSPVGRACIVPCLNQKLITAVDCTIVRPKADIDVKYLNYYMQSPNYYADIQDKVTGATRQRISRKNLAKTEIPLPPLTEQKRIVARLDAAFAEIDKAIAAAKCKQAETNKLKSALLSTELSVAGNQEASVMWEMVKLGDVVSYDKRQGKGSSKPYVGMENITGATMKLIGEIKSASNTSSTFLFDNRHVLFGRLRPYLQKIYLPDFEGQCSTELFCLLPVNELDKRYLAYWLLSPNVSTKIISTSTGARMPRANMDSVLEFEIPLPPLTEQKRIVAKLDAIFEQAELVATNIRQQLEQYHALKSSLLGNWLMEKAA